MKISTLAAGSFEVEELLVSIVLSTAQRELLFVESNERRQAAELLRDLGEHPSRLAVQARGERVSALPSELAAIVARVIEALAHGGNLTIQSLPDELSTTLAADLLGVSRPTLMKMIRDDEIPARHLGSQRRLKTVDILATKRAKLERQALAFEELRRLEDETAAGSQAC